MSLQPKIDEETRRLYIANAELMAHWAARGEAIAKKYKYTGLTGIDAIHRFLIDRYHWLPSQVRALTIDELELLLAGADLPNLPPKGRAGR
jgi:hypothetical protein